MTDIVENEVPKAQICSLTMSQRKILELSRFARQMRRQLGPVMGQQIRISEFSSVHWSG